MYLLSLKTAVPECRMSQEESWQAFAHSQNAARLRPASRRLMERVMLGNSGIRHRHFALEPKEELFNADATILNRAFEREGPLLGGKALQAALESAEIDADQLDALYVCTCTGYLCPGLSSYLSEQIGLRSNAYLQDIVGQGCGAAIPTLRSAANFLCAQPDAKVAVVAVEVCSAAFYVDDDPGVLISAALFSDGAAATIWSGKPQGQNIRIQDFDTIHQPQNRELLRFTNASGKLRNILAPSVPEYAGRAVAQLYARSAAEPGVAIAAHPGGREVIRALESSLPQPPHPAASHVLSKYGNMSSPSVLFVLQEMLASDHTSIWLTTFGAGMTAHSAMVQID